MRRLDRVTTALADPRYTSARIAIELREQINIFHAWFDGSLNPFGFLPRYGFWSVASVQELLDCPPQLAQLDDGI
jgi:hypothetical protein